MVNNTHEQGAKIQLINFYYFYHPTKGRSHSCIYLFIKVLGNQFVFWETDFCFGKLICVLGNRFSFWETVLCFGKLICVLVN